MCRLPIAGRERDAIWDGPGSTGSVVVACPERLVGRYFPGSSIYKRKYQRTHRRSPPAAKPGLGPGRRRCRRFPDPGECCWVWLCTRARLRRSAILESWCRGRWRLGSATHRAWLPTRRTGRLKPDLPVVESPLPSQYRSQASQLPCSRGRARTPAWTATGPSREYAARAAGGFRRVNARTGQSPSRHEQIHAERRAGQHPSRRYRSRSSSVRQHSLRLRWAIRFTAECPVPGALIERLVAARLAEIT